MSMLTTPVGTHKKQPLRPEGGLILPRYEVIPCTPPIDRCHTVYPRDRDPALVSVAVQVH